MQLAFIIIESSARRRWCIFEFPCNYLPENERGIVNSSFLNLLLLELSLTVLLFMASYSPFIHFTLEYHALRTGEKKSFTFDHSYWSHDGFTVDENGILVPNGVSSRYISQENIFTDLGIGILKNASDGYNCSLFAYGQTGSGKSYSVVGYGKNNIAFLKSFPFIHQFIFIF
ncbi:Kinesin-related protein [Echinococcus granulosus]|uniref:Kinesin-related protein n=1 Tax=Echinococcus granulosus TaxID=6210 RepID=W6UMQ1_ECHGR|nr:Kinesin-related protein [Echinococcus granulosus]EUB62333.1 Kinesin-related protein [Echinococcus granulosus]